MRGSTASSGPRYQIPTTVRLPPLRLLSACQYHLQQWSSGLESCSGRSGGVEAGPLCMATLSACNKIHLHKSVRKEEVVAKKKQKRKRQTEVSVEEACIEEESVTYETGAF